MSERLQNQGEQSQAERIAENSRELHEKLENQRESRAEKEANNAERAAEKARQDIDRLEKRAEKESAAPEQSPAERRKARVADRRKLNTDASFKKTMNEARTHMSAPSRTFSKFIHLKPVEKSSEVIGSTIARPNALFFGSLFAFIFTTILYLWTKNAGYPLSGFEAIATFIVGYLVGVIVDFARIMITGKQ